MDNLLQKPQSAAQTTHSEHTGTHTQSEKEDFINEMQEKLDDIQDKIASTRKGGARISAAPEGKSEESSSRFDPKYRALKEQLNRLRQATGDNWKKEKDSFRQSLKDLSNELKEVAH